MSNGIAGLLASRSVYLPRLSAVAWISVRARSAVAFLRLSSLVTAAEPSGISPAEHAANGTQFPILPQP